MSAEMNFISELTFTFAICCHPSFRL